MEPTKPYQDGMDIKKKSRDFELLKKLSAKGIKIEPTVLKLCKKLLIFVSLVFITHAGTAGTDLKSFTASFTGKKVKLFWKMNVENNVNYFSVERSVDGKFYETVGMIKASQKHEENTEYSFIDKDYYDKMVYYRLKRKDNNGGETALAGIIAVQITDPAAVPAVPAVPVIAYSSPYIPVKIYIDTKKINTNNLIVEVTDAEGQKLANKTIDKAGNEIAVEVNAPYIIQKGEYTMTAFYNNQVIKNKLIVKDSSLNLAEHNIKSNVQPFVLR